MKLCRSATVQGRVQHSAAKVILLQALQHECFLFILLTIKSKTQRAWIAVIRFYLLIRRISLDTQYALHFG